MTNRMRASWPDIVAAIVVVAVFWAGSPLGVVLALATGAAMVARRRAPLTATLVAGVATLTGTLLGVCQDPMLATAWCLYPLAVERAARTRLVAAVPVGLFGALALVTGVPEDGLGERLVVAVAALSAAWLLGLAVGRQMAAAREAERARVQLAVARDVHDVVGHALGVIVAEAGVVLSLPDVREDELRETLTAVECHARTALADVQGLVRTLRTDGAAPGTEDLPALFAAVRAAGVRLETTVDIGEFDHAATLFRIVQEALHNVVRHAPGTTCAVDVRREKGEVTVLIRDDGGAGAVPASPGSGLGLTGMRERARLAGGSVTWGARPEGGFQVRASLPLAGDR
ncbi:sensor histidine kinase [Actinoplanes sp. NPDC051851]|uniref:sensor histidine kinase n=1 Tax=Actinoplanes sp. NPDC051851 TaxID=3154753 RepID=UPI00342531E1